MENREVINNDFYDEYGERWYTAQDDPVALLRAENKVKFPWIVERIQQYHPPGRDLLDVACGAGFLTNEFAKFGYHVVGIDQSLESLKVAALYDISKSVQYVEGDAYKLPFPDEHFDIVTNMDFLEHVENPQAIIKECSRVLKKDGLFFFHTFNRNFVSDWLVIRAVEKFVKNTPKNMHVKELFIKPDELKAYCHKAGLEVLEMTGLRPVFSSVSFRSLRSGIVSENMRFTTTRSKLISYLGVARK